MTELSSITSSMYTELTNFLKPTSSTQCVASDSKGLKLQEAAKTVDVSENVENLVVKNNGLETYYSDLISSGVLENIGNNTTAALSAIVASAVGNGMSVQDACNIKNGISAYCKCEENQVAVSVEVDA